MGLKARGRPAPSGQDSPPRLRPAPWSPSTRASALGRADRRTKGDSPFVAPTPLAPLRGDSQRPTKSRCPPHRALAALSLGPSSGGNPQRRPEALYTLREGDALGHDTFARVAVF